MITYDYEDLTFEFSPDGSITEGELEVFKSAGASSFIARVDLAGLRSRKEWVNGACDLYPDAFEAGTLKRALNELCLVVKEEQKKVDEGEPEEEESSTEALNAERYEAAMKLLKSRRLLQRVAVDMKRLGHVGEGRTKQLAFVCAASARAGTPIQPSTHAQSSAGKNYLWDTVLSLFPPEKVVRRSGITGKVLFRTNAPLKNGILYIQEVAGSESADFSIRVLQSDGRLEYESTEKMPDGSLQPVVHTTEGPTVIVQTTTKNHLHPENETRVLPIYIDESEEQTKRITGSILRDAAGKGLKAHERERIRETWRDAIQLLETDVEVIIPFADRINIPDKPLRIRRDARRLVDVIRVLAWLHQHQRERNEDECIVATEDDFYTALKLVSDSFTRAWKNLTPSESKVLEAIKKLPKQLRKEFKRSDLKGHDVSVAQTKRALESLENFGYLECDRRRGAQGNTYALVEDAEETISFGIHLDEPMSHSDKSPAKPPKIMAHTQMSHCEPLSHSEEPKGSNGSIAHNSSSGHEPLKPGDLQDKSVNGSLAHSDDEKNNEGLQRGETELGIYYYED